VKALYTRNVNLVLPYAPAQAEPELTAAFMQALAVRGKGSEAKALADRYFMETAVRLTGPARALPIPACSRSARILVRPSPPPKERSKLAKRMN